MHVRKFDGSASDPVTRLGTKRVRATVVQLPGAVAGQIGAEGLGDRFHGPPVLVDRPTGVVALHFGQNAEIDEHTADEPILFLVVSGNGFVRIGPAQAPQPRSQDGATAVCPNATAACALLCGIASGPCSHDDCLGETAVSAGDAILWPEGLPHKAWTTETSMEAIAIHYGHQV